MNNRYMNQMNDYLEGGQGSAPRQHGAFANMVPRQTMIRDQPHMLAYINPTEEQMLRDMGGSGLPGPDGVPAYDHWFGHSAAQWAGDKISSGVDYVKDAYDFFTADSFEPFNNIGGDASVNNTTNGATNDDTTAATDTGTGTGVVFPADGPRVPLSYGEFSANINLDNGQSIPFTQYADGTVAYFPDGAGGQSFSSEDAVNQYLGIAANQNEQWTSPDTGAVTNFYTDGTSVTGDPVAGFIPNTNVTTAGDPATTTTGSVTLYKDGEPPITQPSDSVAVWEGMGWSTTPPAFTNNAVTTDASELMNQINADTALTNVGTGAAGTGDASTKGLYEIATGKKFEDTFAGELIGVTDDSFLGSEGAADAAVTSFTDFVDGGGKGASGDEFEGNGALSNLIAGTANALGVSTFDEDAGFASGEGSVYDVLTDAIVPTKIITNVLTGGEGVAGTIGNALEGTPVGEFLEDNIPQIANQLRIDNDSASVDNVLNEIAGGLTGQDAIDATVGYVVNEAIDNAVASNPGSSYDGNVDPDGDGIGTIYVDTNNNQQFDEGENTFASDDIYTDYPMIDYDEDLVGTEIIDPVITTSGPTRTDRTTDEMMDYTRRYIKDYSGYLPEYLKRFTIGETIDGMFNEFVGEDGKTYYRTPEGEIYDAEKFINAATGKTATISTGEKIVVGYTETDDEGNSIDYDNEGNRLDGSDGGFDFGAPANLGDTYYDPELDTTYTYQEKPDGQGGFYSGWDITEGSGGMFYLDPREMRGGFEGNFDFVTADMVPQYDQEGNAIVNADGSPVFGTSTGNGTPNGTGSTVVVGSR